MGTVIESGELDFHYQHINEQKQVRVGVCHSVPRILDNGKMELAEKWKWLNGDKAEGASVSEYTGDEGGGHQFSVFGCI